MKLLPYVALIGVLAPALASVNAQDKAIENLLKNGGFETWDGNYQPPRLPPQYAKSVPRLVDNLEPVGCVPNAGTPYENQAGDNPVFPITVTITREDKIRHGGLYAVKIANEADTDIGYIAFNQLPVSPKQTYTFKGWYKMEGVEPNPKPGDGVGVAFWFNEMQDPSDSHAEVTRTMQRPQINSGSSEWQVFEYTFTTKPATSVLTIAVQLRRAKGTVWFDDFELVPAKPNL